MNLITVVKKSVREPKKAFGVFLYRALSLVGHRRYRKFIVLTRDRTGSNMLVSFLNSHPNIKSEYEVFAKLFGASEDSILQNSFGKQPFYIKAKGFKIFYYHPQDESGSSIWEILEKNENLYVIHLKRHNILHAAVSSRIAYQTKVYGVLSVEEKAEYQKKADTIEFSPDELFREFRKTRDWEKNGDQRFKDHPMLEVSYENITSDPNGEFKKITEFLGVDYRAPKTDFKKQRTKSLREIVVNYDELKQDFADTEWVRFFDD